MTYLNLNQLSKKIGGHSRSSIYRDVENERIPAPIRIGSRLNWIETEVDAAARGPQRSRLKEISTNHMDRQGQILSAQLKKLPHSVRFLNEENEHGY